MGADLYYKVETLNDAKKFNKLIEKHNLFSKLNSIDYVPYVTDFKDKEFYKNIDCLHIYKSLVKTGVFKVSGICDDSLICYNSNDKCKELYTDLSIILGDVARILPVKFLINSCAFTIEEYYFTIENMKYMTNNGLYLSNKTEKKELIKLIETL